MLNASDNQFIEDHFHHDKQNSFIASFRSHKLNI